MRSAGWAFARLRRELRSVTDSQALLLILFTVAVVVVVGLAAAWPQLFPAISLILVLMVGAFWLRLRGFGLLVLVAAAGLALLAHRVAGSLAANQLLVLALSAGLMALFVRGRELLGVQGTTGASMLVDLRDRIRSQDGSDRVWPRGWHVQSAIQSANGEAFSGDFFVVAGDEETMQAVVVDISGKGHHAGTRALMLSAAFGGLLGALPAADFLPGANRYLLRQNWDEGFATAVHLLIDLRSGRYEIRHAGHPPAAHFRAGSGTWELLNQAGGPALGIVEEAGYHPVKGTLCVGDALMMYTDGLVENPGRDLDLGIDRLLGDATALVAQTGLAQGAQRLVNSADAQEDDDRSLMLIWRD